MTNEKFVQAIFQIMSSALAGLLKSIKTPPGRKPASDLIKISEFYNKLDERDRPIFRAALELAARQSINNFLLVLDGSVAIESGGRKGELEIFYNIRGKRNRLNDPNEDPLSEIFRSLC